MREKPRSHFGFIKHTKPKPHVLWGTMAEIAAQIGGNRRNLYLAWNGKRNGYLGYFPIKSEEDIAKYYQPPKPPPPINREALREKKREMWNDWKITMYKDWKKGDPSPQESNKVVVGTAYQVQKHINIDRANMNKMIMSYEGRTPPAYSNMWTYKGWRIARIQKKGVSVVPQVKIYMTKNTREVRKEYRRLRVEEYKQRNEIGDS